MTKREYFLFFAIFVVVVCLIAVWFGQSTPAEKTPKQPTATSSPPATQASSPPSALVDHMDDNLPLSLKSMSVDEATKIYLQRLKKDPDYDWKRPLNFYGKVIDENNQPVAGATAHFEWNTLDAQYGTAEGQALSDGEGRFSLTDKRGKVLEVHVEKDGYYSVDRGGSALPFEFAAPFSHDWYEADLNNPVIFHLRRKGEGANLFSKTLTIPVSRNHPQAQVNLMRGLVKPDGTLAITSDTSQFLPGAQAFPWTVELSMAEGGLLETDDQFPFLAPTSGYTSTVTIDMTNLDRSVWRGDVTKTFYFYLPSTNTYGRVTITASSSLSPTLNDVYNLTPGSRVLEPENQ